MKNHCCILTFLIFILLNSCVYAPRTPWTPHKEVYLLGSDNDHDRAKDYKPKSIKKSKDKNKKTSKNKK